MKKLVLILLSLVFISSLASAVSDEAICDKAFFLIIDGKEDIFLLREKVGENVSIEFISNYTSKCKGFRVLPTIKEKEITNITLCDIELDKPVFWDSFNLNKSVFNSISYQPKTPTCESIQTWKWIFKVEESNNEFIYTGLRVWWIILLAILIPTLSFMKAKKRVYKQIEKELRYAKA